MKVTSLKQQLKNTERVSIFVDGQYSFSLSLDQLVKHKLLKNQELSQADLKKFKKLSEDGKLRARSLEWLLNRPHSTREFKDYLYRKKADPELMAQLITEFTSRGYLNDLKFAAWFIERGGRKNKSARAISAELSSKGIDRETAQQAFETQTIDEGSTLRELIAKKQKLSRYQNDPIKLTRYLVGKGFSYQAVKNALTDSNT